MFGKKPKTLNSMVARPVSRRTWIWLAVIMLAGILCSTLFVLGAREHFSAIANHTSDDKARTFWDLAVIIASSVVISVFSDVLFRSWKIGRSRLVRRQALRLSTFLLSLFLSDKESEAIVGDFIEEYEEIRFTAGEFRARLWLCMQVLASVWPMLRKAISEKLPFGVRRN